MKILLLFVGKTMNGPLSELLTDYVGRLKHYAPFAVEVIPDVRNARSMSEEQIREKEGAMILKTLLPTDCVVLLDDKGEAYTSMQLSKWLDKKQQTARRLVFVIGGAYGFSQTVYQRSNELLSLSKMTFSHQLVRVIFAEQLYRAFTILNNEPYHHE